MPQDDQINYNVKVRLDPDDITSDKSVIYDSTAKKFTLSTAASSDIVVNEGSNRITVSNNTNTEVVANSYFRFIEDAGGVGGTGAGKLQIGSTSAVPLQLVDIGQNNDTDNQILISSTNGDQSFLRLGMDSTDTLVAAFGSKTSTNQKFQVGTYPSATSPSFTPYLSMNHSGRVGLGEGTSPVLGKSYIDSNWQLFTTRTFTNTIAQDEDEWVGTAAFQNSSTNATNKVKVLQLYTGTLASNYPEGGSTESNSYTRFIEFYARNNINENYLLGHISANNYAWAPPGVAIYSVSDKRLKKDIKTLSVGLDKLLKIQPVEYKWKINKGKGYDKGFIAQDLHKIYPEAVQVPLTDNAEKDPWTISPTKLIPLLVKSIQDQQEIIKKLENRINNLENKIK
jgi:hypothetical protein